MSSLPSWITSASHSTTLSLSTPDGSIRHIPLRPSQRITIGRQINPLTRSTSTPNCLPCPIMSKQHAEVWEAGHKIFIRDLGSRNGTFVNGERLSHELCESEAYELRNNDTLEFCKTFEADGHVFYNFLAEITFTIADSRDKPGKHTTSTAVEEAVSHITDWIDGRGDDSILCWFTHPGAQARSTVAHRVAQHCTRKDILSPRLFLSRRSIEGWDLARLFSCQLCQSIPGLQPLRDHPLPIGKSPSFGDVDNESIRKFFIEPLITYTPSPMVVIIDSLDLRKHDLLRPLMTLAMLLRVTRELPIKLLMTTHPDIRIRTQVGRYIEDARVLKEMHIVHPLDRLPHPKVHYQNIRKNVFAFLQDMNEFGALPHARLSTAPLATQKEPGGPTAQSGPLAILLDNIRWEQELSLILEEMKTSLDHDPAFRDALQMDNREDEKTNVRIFRDVLRSENEKAAARTLRGLDAQSFVDFSQELLDQGSLIRFHGYDFDRKARRLIVNVVTESDILPASLFIQSGISLSEPDPYSGGGYSDIYRATHGERHVALKRLRVYRGNFDRDRINRKFCREALMWRPLQHAHVMPFLGVDANTFPSYLCMVSPWMENGTLPELRKRYGAHNIDIEARILEVAEGLEYLHFEKIIHGDLRGANILIDENRHVRLADFGLTVFSDATIATQSDLGGCVRWMAPELFMPEELEPNPLKTEETDVYAFACVYFEIYRGLAPFAEITLDPAVIHCVSQGRRPTRPVDDGDSIAISETAWQLVNRCWKHDRWERPTMDIVVEEMRTQLRSAL